MTAVAANHKLPDSAWAYVQASNKKGDEQHVKIVTHHSSTHQPHKASYKHLDVNANGLPSSPNEVSLLNRPKERPTVSERIKPVEKLVIELQKDGEKTGEKTVVVTRIQPHFNHTPVPPARTDHPRAIVRQRAVRTILNPQQVTTNPSKRGPSGPLTTTSDEDSDNDPASPRGQTTSSLTGHPSPRDHALSLQCDRMPSPTPFSDDYESVTSPGELTDASSTCSGPVYEREPGFEYHAHTFTSTASKPRQKKKKPAPQMLQRDVLKRRVSTPPKLRPKRESIPMRNRALPQSFWQQPTSTQSVCPAPSYLPSLPPLLGGRDDLTEVRPVTPPEDKHRKKGSDRKLIVGNVDLLSSLFEVVDTKQENPSAAPTPAVRRVRTKKSTSSQHSTAKGLLNGNDPCLVEAMSDKLFPQLSLEGAKGQGTYLHVVSFKEGDRTVNLPSLQHQEPNYQQMLHEVAMNI